MEDRAVAWRVLAVCLVACLAAVVKVAWFPSDTDVGIVDWIWAAALLSPLVGVGAVAWLKPVWWIVPAQVAFLFAFPLVFRAVGSLTGLEPVTTDCDPCVDSTIWSVFAVPAMVTGFIGLVAGWRRRRP